MNSEQLATNRVLVGKRVGFALTGSFCTFERIMPVVEALVSAGAVVYPIMSENSYGTDTRFGASAMWCEKLAALTGNEVWHTIVQTEPVGPKKLLDILVVAPCTGNTLAKLAHGVTDTSVTMACKAHLRNARPVVLAVSTNDGLSTAAMNIGHLQTRKHVYFVPYGQDDPQGKPQSLVAEMERIPETAAAAAAGLQFQPVLV